MKTPEEPNGAGAGSEGDLIKSHEVAEMLGVSSVTRRMEKDAVRLYEQGWPIRRVAAEFGCSHGKMRRILLKHTLLHGHAAACR